MGMSVVHIATSFFENSHTADDIYVQLIGSCGVSEEKLIGGGVNFRISMDMGVAHDQIGELQALKVRLTGNDAIHLGEVRVIYGGDEGGEFSWILSELGGWIDGDSGTNGAPRYFLTGSASPVISGASQTVALNWNTSNSAMGNPYLLTMYGSNGHMAPIVMGGDRTDGPGTFTFTMGDIGVFSAMKILCSGNDGWLIDDLTMQISNSAGVESQAWPYYQWIDGDGHRQAVNATGSYTNAPNYEIFYPGIPSLQVAPSWSSQAGVTYAEIRMTCPTQYDVCMSTTTCPPQIAAVMAAGDLNPPTGATTETLSLLQCIGAAVDGTCCPAPTVASDCSGGR